MNDFFIENSDPRTRSFICMKHEKDFFFHHIVEDIG